MTSPGGNWRWTNFPIPEAHLMVGTAGVGLGFVWPLDLGLKGSWALVIALVLTTAGVALMIWATASAGRVLLADPDQLVTDGPYRISRHPMYLGWTLVYVALMLLLDSAWLLILFPVLAVWIHLETGREERKMLQRFGEPYALYQGRVRRYL